MALKKLDIEKILEQKEMEKDSKALGDIVDKLPGDSRVKIYKRDEDTLKKIYITSVPADEFSTLDPHEYIKNTYSKRFGSGEYIIEMYDGDKLIDSRVINVISPEEEDEVSHIEKAKKLVDEALEMKERAIEKMEKVAEKKIEEEEKKTFTIVELISRQWETIMNMYRDQINMLRESKDQSPLIQEQIRKLELEMERAKMQMDAQIKSAMAQESSKSHMELIMSLIANKGNDKLYELISSLIPQIIQKSSDTKEDPVEKTLKVIELAEKISGGRKDFFEELLSNPQKFEAFKIMIGLDKYEKTYSQMIDALKSLNKPVEIEHKGVLDELVETAQKIEYAKPILRNLLGVQSQPARSLVELISNVLTTSAPHIVNAVNSYINGMVMIEMIRKGLIGREEAVRILGGSGFSGAQTHRAQRIQTGEIPERQSQQIEHSRDGGREMNIEHLFVENLVNIVSSGELPAEAVADKLADVILSEYKRNPMVIVQILKYGGKDNIVKRMTELILNTIAVPEEVARMMSLLIVEKVTGSLASV
jgi:hypothetical protein